MICSPNVPAIHCRAILTYPYGTEGKRSKGNRARGERLTEHERASRVFLVWSYLSLDRILYATYGIIRPWTLASCSQVIFILYGLHALLGLPDSEGFFFVSLLFSSQTLLSPKMSWKARKISLNSYFSFCHGVIDLGKEKHPMDRKKHRWKKQRKKGRSVFRNACSCVAQPLLLL